MKLIYLNIILLALFLCSCSNQSETKVSEKDKIAYVQNQLLYSEFEMTKELNVDYDNVVKQRKAQLDSIELQMRAIEGSSKNAPLNEELVFQYQQLQSLYMQQYKSFEESNKILENQHFEAVWNRLNSYVQEFSKKEGYTFVLGATGSGNLMYADEGNDITKEALNYCNKKYKGE